MVTSDWKNADNAEQERRFTLIFDLRSIRAQSATSAFYQEAKLGPQTASLPELPAQERATLQASDVVQNWYDIMTSEQKAS